MNINLAKFKEECQSVRRLRAVMDPKSDAAGYLKAFGIREFYRNFTDAEEYRTPVTPAPVAPPAPRTLEDFASEVRGAQICTPWQMRATYEQVRAIIGLAGDLEDYRPLGQATLSRSDARNIIRSLQADVERLTAGDL